MADMSDKTADKRPKQPERYETPVCRNGAKGATIGQLVVNYNYE
jgi:hypothetical protein